MSDGVIALVVGRQAARIAHAALRRGACRGHAACARVEQRLDQIVERHVADRRDGRCAPVRSIASMVRRAVELALREREIGVGQDHAEQQQRVGVLDQRGDGGSPAAPR